MDKAAVEAGNEPERPELVPAPQREETELESDPSSPILLGSSRRVWAGSLLLVGQMSKEELD